MNFRTMASDKTSLCITCRTKSSTDIKSLKKKQCIQLWKCKNITGIHYGQKHRPTKHDKLQQSTN